MVRQYLYLRYEDNRIHNTPSVLVRNFHARDIEVCVSVATITDERLFFVEMYARSDTWKKSGRKNSMLKIYRCCLKFCAEELQIKFASLSLMIDVILSRIQLIGNARIW